MCLLFDSVAFGRVEDVVSMSEDAGMEGCNKFVIAVEGVGCVCCVREIVLVALFFVMNIGRS